MSKVVIKKGATFPYYETFLTTGKEGLPLDLTSAKEVLIYLKARKSKAVTEDKMSIGTPANSGLVIWKWKAAVYNTVDVFDVEFKVIWNSGEVDIFPNEGDEEVEVVEPKAIP